MKIVISIDGSEFSRAAVEKCCRIVADPDNTQIRLVTAYHLMEPIDIVGTPEAYTRELEATAQKQAKEYVDEAAAMIRERFAGSNIVIDSDISQGGQDSALMRVAEEWGADMIVVGSHGRSFVGRLIFGSVTDALVHHAPCCVLVVRTAATG